ncbi:Uncharacterized protein Rs2_09046 [Raphanus sativus]|nr:Uncharacterized protein Rs2_09046 [Raphanus sativus]
MHNPVGSFTTRSSIPVIKQGSSSSLWPSNHYESSDPSQSSSSNVLTDDPVHVKNRRSLWDIENLTAVPGIEGGNINRPLTRNFDKKINLDQASVLDDVRRLDPRNSSNNCPPEPTRLRIWNTRITWSSLPGSIMSLLCFELTVVESW